MLNYVEEFLTSLVIALASGVVWLFRTVFTNQKQIALLQEDLKLRDQKLEEDMRSRERVRNEDRAILLELKADLKSELKETKENMEYIRSELTQVWKERH